MQKKDRYTIKKFPRIRQATVDLLKAAKRKNMIHSFIEVDITKARSLLRERKRQTGDYISLTGFIIHCVAVAVEQQKHVHAYRDWLNRLILFDDVDVSITIERKVGGENEVVAAIIRAANRKTVTGISREIQEEKQKNVRDAEVFRLIHLYLAIPAFIRRLVFIFLDRSPGQMKKRAGTIMVTSVPMVGVGAGWGLPIASHTLNITVGAVIKRPKEIEGKVVNREHICLTVSFDHDIVDGAPAARFIRQLTKLLESGQSMLDSQSGCYS
jgi:pyruvate/2-oxoglutarate dehydrogenase complex dihydrolipoamide acyltransferase (E2) component